MSLLICASTPMSPLPCLPFLLSYPHIQSHALLSSHTGHRGEDSDEEADSRDAGHTATGEGGQEN